MEPSTYLRVQNIVHTENDKGDHGRRLRCSRGPDNGAQIRLQLSSSGIDLPKPAVIPCFKIMTDKRRDGRLAWHSFPRCTLGFLSVLFALPLPPLC
jgi:hypothetical protein